MKYTDPTGEAIAVIPFIAPTVIAGVKAFGAWLVSLFVIGAAATAVGVTLDAAIDGSKSESPSDSSTVPSPLIDSGVSSAGTMPPSPDDDENREVESSQSAKDSKKLNNNSEANKFAQDKGYKDAHDLKESYVGKRNISKYDIYHNQKTQESFLIDKKGITIIPIE